jgi:hypothetical protein
MAIVKALREIETIQINEKSQNNTDTHGQQDNPGFP